jgi:hypothetical protein
MKSALLKNAIALSNIPVFERALKGIQYEYRFVRLSILGSYGNGYYIRRILETVELPANIVQDAFQTAICSGNVEIVKVFIEKECVEPNYDKMLIMSTYYEYIDMVEFALQLGANPSVEDSTCLWHSTVSENTLIRDILLKYGAKSTERILSYVMTAYDHIDEERKNTLSMLLNTYTWDTFYEVDELYYRTFPHVESLYKQIQNIYEILFRILPMDICDLILRFFNITMY